MSTELQPNRSTLQKPDTATLTAPHHVKQAILDRIREAQRVQDREKALRQRHTTLHDAAQTYPSMEVLASMIFLAALALLLALLFGVVSVAVVYAPAITIDAITIIVLRQIAGLKPHSYWRRLCLVCCSISAHLVLTATVVPLIDIAFRVTYRLQESSHMQSTSMRDMQHLFRYWLGGDICILLISVACTVFAVLTCLLCYATREPIYTSYAVIDLRKLE